MICLFLVACQPEYQVPPDKVRIHIGAEPATLNLMTASDAYASQVNYYIFDNLIERDKETLEIKPKLATHWTISPDKKTYTFYLRKDVTWHDGKPFTADDVIYSFNLLKDPELKAPHLKVYYQDLDKVTKIDDIPFNSTTIKFTF